MRNASFYLTNKSGPDGAYLILLPVSELDRDTRNNDLSAAGWRYAEFGNTGFRVLVRSKGNRRYLKSWSSFVTDFEVCEVDTVVDNDGVIWAEKGASRGLSLYCRSEFLN